MRDGGKESVQIRDRSHFCRDSPTTLFTYSILECASSQPNPSIFMLHACVQRGWLTLRCAEEYEHHMTHDASVLRGGDCHAVHHHLQNATLWSKLCKKCKIVTILVIHSCIVNPKLPLRRSLVQFHQVQHTSGRWITRKKVHDICTSQNVMFQNGRPSPSLFCALLAWADMTPHSTSNDRKCGLIPPHKTNIIHHLT